MRRATAPSPVKYHRSGFQTGACIFLTMPVTCYKGFSSKPFLSFPVCSCSQDARIPLQRLNRHEVCTVRQAEEKKTFLHQNLKRALTDILFPYGTGKLVLRTSRRRQNKTYREKRYSGFCLPGQSAHKPARESFSGLRPDTWLSAAPNGGGSKSAFLFFCVCCLRSHNPGSRHERKRP